MIGRVIELLHSDEWEGVSENVEIAKGKYHRVTSVRDLYRRIRRSIRHVRKISGRAHR